MEYSQCVRKEALDRLKEFYANMAKHAKVPGKASGGFVSGGTAASGGLVALNEYADSVYSTAKEGLIRKIARDMNDVLGIKGNRKFNADGDITEIVKQMNEILPNPRKRRGIRSNKGTETKYTGIHKDLCRALAESINKNYGSGIVDLEQSDNALCNSVSEVIHSLISGMHAEFSTVAADVGQVIRNLTVMMEFLKRSHEKLRAVINASNDPSIQSQVEVVDKFYEKLVKETNRQLAVLNNLMGGVVSPVGNDFLQILRESEDFKGFVEDIKGTLGSEEFGNKLGYLLAGVNNVAQTAKMVDKALKEIGMSVKDYKKTSGIENLRDEIYNLLSKADKMTADELIKFMKAADILYRNDMQHPQIVEYLEKHKVSGGSDGGNYSGCPNCGGAAGGNCGCMGAAGGYNGGQTGGADLDFKDMFERKESVVTDKFNQQDKVRKMIFNDFEKQLLTMYQRIISVVQQVGPKIGSEIGVSDDLMKFVRAFNQIEGANRNSIASALSGYNRSGVAKDMRNSFLSSLEVVDVTLDPLVAKHNLFRDLRQEINLLIKLVDQFSTKFLDAVTMMPSFTSSVPSAVTMSGGETGGEVGGIIVNSDPPVGMAERYASFGRAQFQLYYFSRIASIKRSMARAATEKKSVSEDYVRLVGQATARLINEQASDYKKHLDSLAHWDKSYESWTDEKEFDEKLPKGSPGRALYFYVNTIAGFEPLKTGTSELPNYYRGNIEGLGVGTAGEAVPRALPGGVNDVWNAKSIDWNAVFPANAFAAAVPAHFQFLWNFREAPTNEATADLDGPGPGDHLPVTIRIDRSHGASIADPCSNLFGLLGVKIEDLRETKSGAVAGRGAIPKAFDKSFKGSLMQRRHEAAGKLVDIIRELETRAFNAKKDLIEVAENIDLYLSSFTDSMLAKPESLLSLAKILQRVAVVRKMYTEHSGDSLAKVFESFPIHNLNGVEVSAANTAPFFNNGGLVRKPGQNLNAGAAAGSAVEYKGDEHYYEYVSRVSGSNSCVGHHKLALDLSTILGGTRDNPVESLVKNIEKSVLGVRTLENILLAFVQLGNEQTTQTFLTHGKVLKSLFNYVTVSAITRHYSNDAALANNDHPVNQGIVAAVDHHILDLAVAGSVFAGANINERSVSIDAYGPLKMALGVTMNQITSYAGNSMFKDDFKTTDKIMEMVLKAICSKVLTVLGLYQIYNKPTANYLSFGAIRTILGGGDVDRPKIIPEAIDLYVRLPLLAEWFRDVLVGPSGSTNRSHISSDNYMLAMIPDVTNLWGEFLKTIFIRGEIVEEGNYSESDTNTLITEINRIYNSYKTKNNVDTVLAACEGLVTEINTRYSIVRKTDVDKYWSRMSSDRFLQEDYDKTENDFVDFDLLDSKSGIKVKPAPSDRFMDVNLITAAKESSWSHETFDVIKSLHAKMFHSFNDNYTKLMKDSELANPDEFINEGKFSILKFSFDGVIRQYRDELKVAATEEEKYRIACKAIQDVGKMADVNPDKIVMLHEFVIAPLTSLMSTYNLVRNIIESFIWMSKETLTKVLTYLDEVKDISQRTIGVFGNANDSKIAHTGTNHVNEALNVQGQALYDLCLQNALEYFHPQAAPFLSELFVKHSELNEHGLTPHGGVAPTDVFAAANGARDPERCRFLSTKRLFKTHMQLFANLKSALGDKFHLNFTNKSYPVIDFGGLVSHCESVLNNIKKALIYLRPVIPLSVIKKYENPRNIGSVYWIEENMFSDLFYNEKHRRKSDETTIAANPNNAQTIVQFYSDDKFKFNPTLALLNEVLKDSFSLVVNRSKNNALNGKSLCEKGLLELCAWNLGGRPDRFEVNNEMKSDFPFNVVDMIDDLDPALGKVRRLLMDKSMQTAVAEITKKLGTLEGNNVNRGLFDKIFNMLRALSLSGPGNAARGIPSGINMAMPVDQARDLDTQYATANPPVQLITFLTDTMLNLFVHDAGAGGSNKIGTPAFGTMQTPFYWNAQSDAVNANVNAVNACVGINAQAAGLNETDGKFAVTFEEHREAVEAARLAAIAAGNAANAIPAATRVDAPLIVPNVLNAANNATRRLVANRFGRYLVAQINELNNRFNVYIDALAAVRDPEVVEFLRKLPIPNAVRTDIEEVANMVSRIRFTIGYQHLRIATTYGAAVSTISTGIGDPANNIYVPFLQFRQDLNPLIGQVVETLYHNKAIGIDRELRDVITNNLGDHTDVIGNLSPTVLRGHLTLNSGAWNDGANLFDAEDANSFTIFKGGNQAATLIRFWVDTALEVWQRVRNDGGAGPLGAYHAVHAGAAAHADRVAHMNLEGAGAVPADWAAALVAGRYLGNNFYACMTYLSEIIYIDAQALAVMDAVVNAATTGAGGQYLTGAMIPAANAGALATALAAANARTFAMLVDDLTAAARFAHFPVVGGPGAPRRHLNLLASCLEQGMVELLGGVQAGGGAAVVAPAGPTFFTLAFPGGDYQRYYSVLTTAVQAQHAQSPAGLFEFIQNGAVHATVQNTNRPALANINNNHVFVTSLTQLQTTNVIIGSWLLPSVVDHAMVLLHTGAQACDADLNDVGLVMLNAGSAARVALNRLSARQADGLTADMMPSARDNAKAESWLRRFVVQYIGNRDTDFLRSQVDNMMKEFYGFDSNNNSNIRPRFEGLNAAFIVNRLNLYDQWGSNGPLATDKKDSEKSIFSSRGLLVQFNQLLGAYIGTFVEPGTKKFYSPLVEGLVSSKISDAVTSGNAIADINLFHANAVGIPPEGSVVFSSIARAIRTLLYKRQENSKESFHATNSLLEVAGFMRESMKGNLPHFARMFNQLADVASMYKKVLLDNPAVQYERVAPGAAGGPVVGYDFDADQKELKESEKLFSKSQKLYVDPNSPASQSEVIRYYRVLLDNVEMGCMAAVRCISTVYKELNDVPLFGETYSGSLIDFKQKSGKYPLALPSVLQSLLHHSAYNAGVGLPAAKHGSEGFKMLFMSRRVLTETPVVKISGGSSYLDFMPGLIETINNYNAINPEPSKIPKPLIESSIKANLDLLNMLIDLKVRGAWIVGADSAGGSMFRREVYGSAQEVEVDRSDHTGANGFNGLSNDTPFTVNGITVGTANVNLQTELRKHPEFVKYARSRGLAPTNKNQSIYVFRDASTTYKMKYRDAAGVVTEHKHPRSNVSVNRFVDAAGGGNTIHLVFNSKDGYAADPNPAWALISNGIAGGAKNPLFAAPADDAGKYVVVYSDKLEFPTALVSYPFAVADTLSELITLVESTDLQYNKRHLLKLFAGVSEEYDSRKSSRFYNILDLNIVPINVHALQSKVPLINLLNYSFTFDKFVVEKLNLAGMATEGEIFPESTDNIDNVKAAFARMLIHPYKGVPAGHFNTWHSRVAVGATGSDIPMDRPKYFSDQIYNKVCLQSLNPSDFTNPGGPGYVMENLRSTNVSRADVLAAIGAFFHTNQLLTNLALAAGPVAVNEYSDEQKRTVDRALLGIRGANLANHRNSLTPLRPPAAAGRVAVPNGANDLSVAYINAWRSQALAHAKTRYDTQLAAAGPLNAATTNQKALAKVVYEAVVRAINAFAGFGLTWVGRNPGVNLIRTPDNKIIFQGAAHNVLETEYFAVANYDRTVTIFVAEAILAYMANGNVQLPQRVDALYYINDKEEVKRYDLANNGSLIVNVQGKLRYDTRLVRNLSWFSHLHRFLLWSIKDALVKSSQPVVSDQGVIDPTLIDFRGYQSQQRSEYHL